MPQTVALIMLVYVYFETHLFQVFQATLMADFVMIAKLC